MAISLLASWLIAMTVTPMNCISLLKPPSSGDAGADRYASGIFVKYRRLLEGAIRKRFLTIGALSALLVVATIGFPGIPQEFFPDSTRA